MRSATRASEIEPRQAGPSGEATGGAMGNHRGGGPGNNAEHLGATGLTGGARSTGYGNNLMMQKLSQQKITDRPSSASAG